MTFDEYVRALYQDIPLEVFLGLLAVLCFGVAVIISCYGWKRGWRKIVGLMLFEYIILIYCSTVVYRTYLETRGHNFIPFWSYSKPELMAENMMNVAVFVPVGVLLGSLFSDERSGRAERRVKGAWLIALIVGMSISVSIEVIQLVTKRGFAETDDVIHNTVGCIVGYMLVKGSRFMVHGLTRKI